MAAFLYFVLFVVLFLLISVAAMGLVLFHKVKSFLGMGKQRSSHTHYYNNRAGTNYRAGTNHSAGNNYSAGNNNRAGAHWQQQANGEPTVEDRRSPNAASQKIIPREEGEYVEFEEVK